VPIKQANIALYQGDDWAAQVTVLNADMTPADLTGYTAQAQIRAGVADQQPVVAAQMSATVNPPNQVLLALTHAQTAPMSGQYVWDLQVTSPGGIITTLLAGSVGVSQEVTRTAAAAMARAPQAVR
jgi:hypothetical protein